MIIQLINVLLDHDGGVLFCVVGVNVNLKYLMSVNGNNIVVSYKMFWSYLFIHIKYWSMNTVNNHLILLY